MAGRKAAENEQIDWEKAESNLLMDKRTLALNNIYGSLRFLITEQRKTNELLNRIIHELTR